MNLYESISATFWASMGENGMPAIAPSTLKFPTHMQTRRSGMTENIRCGSETAWKDFFAKEMEQYMAIPFAQKLLEKELFDAVHELGSRKKEIETYMEEARNNPPSIATGRKVCEESQKNAKVASLKRKLSAMTESGDDVAGLALKKLKEETDEVKEEEQSAGEEPDGEGKPEEEEEDQSKTRKRKRQKKKKKTGRKGGAGKNWVGYRRQHGDELRLLKKREIVPVLILAS